MAKYVDEIVNPELFSLSPSESVSNALLGLLAMRITAAPVVSTHGRAVGMISLRDLIGDPQVGTVAERMTQPVHMIAQDAQIEEAGRRLAEHDIHHLVVVDEQRRVVGVVSSLDVLRALLGFPVRYPEAFPHIDREGLAWTDPAMLNLEHAALAPNGPGLLVLIHGGAGQPELPLWAESANNLYDRVHELLSVPQDETPYLAQLLEHGADHLRFRAAPIADPTDRAHALERARDQVKRSSGLQTPTTEPE